MERDLNHPKKNQSPCIWVHQLFWSPSPLESILSSCMLALSALCNGGRPQVIPLCSTQGVIVSVWCISNYQG